MGAGGDAGAAARTVLFIGGRPHLQRLLGLGSDVRVLWFRDLEAAWRFLQDCPGARIFVDLPALAGPGS